MPKLRAAGSSRVISLASRAHFRHQEDIDYVRLKNESAATYDGWTAYGRSKLSNILMTKVPTPSHEKKNKTKEDSYFLAGSCSAFSSVDWRIFLLEPSWGSGHRSFSCQTVMICAMICNSASPGYLWIVLQNCCVFAAVRPLTAAVAGLIAKGAPTMSASAMFVTPITLNPTEPRQCFTMICSCRCTHFRFCSRVGT